MICRRLAGTDIIFGWTASPGRSADIYGWVIYRALYHTPLPSSWNRSMTLSSYADDYYIWWAIRVDKPMKCWFPVKLSSGSTAWSSWSSYWIKIEACYGLDRPTKEQPRRRGKQVKFNEVDAFLRHKPSSHLFLPSADDVDCWQIWVNAKDSQKEFYTKHTFAKVTSTTRQMVPMVEQIWTPSQSQGWEQN